MDSFIRLCYILTKWTLQDSSFPATSTLATAVLEEEYFRDLFVAFDGETETLREYFSPGFIDFSAALVEMLFTRIVLR